MSHAWDGFRMTSTSFDEAMDVVDAFRPTAARMLGQWNARLHADAAVALLDQAWTNNVAPVDFPLSTARADIEERRLRIVRSEQRDPHVDPEFRLTLLRHRGRVHGLVHTERTEWRAAWHMLAEVSDFSWWNGSDRPDKTSKSEWLARERAWKAMVPDMWPAGHGVFVVLTPRHFDLAPAEVLAAIPDMETRLRRAAANLAISRRISHMTVQSNEMSHLVAAASHASGWILSDEGIAERGRLMTEINLPEIDLATLLGFDPEKRWPKGQKEDA